METLNAYYSIIPSDFSYVCGTVNEIIEYVCHTCGQMDEATAFEVKVVLNELLVNAIKHGNREDTSKHIKIDVGVKRNNKLYVVVTDEGEGYCCLEPNPCEKHMKESGCDYLEEAGRGLLIVKSLCETVKFNNKGNKVVVLKKILK